MTTPQKPLRSGFGPRTSATDVLAGISLTGKHAIVTGGYSGIGLETTRALADAGAHVTVPARDRAKAEGALCDLAGRVTIEDLDLSAPASVAAFAQRFVAHGAPLHMLINNAGIMAAPLARDAAGHESQFATNHLGHFRLTCGLWPALKAASGARVVQLSSIGHRLAPINFDDLDFRSRPYDKWAAYGQSKTANALFAVALDQRGQSSGVRAFAVHPGGIMTDLQRYLPQEEQMALGWIDASGQPHAIFKTPSQGAATSVWCATSPQLDAMGGVYCEDCDIAAAAPADDAGWSGVRPHAIDAAQAARLWEISEMLTGLSFH
jgi:NAD(P)-dependent dehydrogenase (short-subunit alcohol dehydrogenase family)